MKELFRLNQSMVDGSQKYDFWVVIKKRFVREDARKIEGLFVDSLKRVKHR